MEREVGCQPVVHEEAQDVARGIGHVDIDPVLQDPVRWQGLQRIGRDNLLPDPSGEEDVARAERGEDEGVDEQAQVETAAAPRCGGVPNDETRHRGDVTVAL